MDIVRFAARKLKPYGKYVKPSGLVEGEIYYTVHFLDDQMLVPELNTLVFIGRNLERADSGRLYFRREIFDPGRVFSGNDCARTVIKVKATTKLLESRSIYSASLGDRWTASLSHSSLNDMLILPNDTRKLLNKNPRSGEKLGQSSN